MTTAAPKLTPRQTAFVQHYVVSGNGAAAAREAGFEPRSARVTACDLLAKPNVAHQIRRLRQARAKKLWLEQEHVIKGLLDAVAAAKRQGNAALQVLAWREIGLLIGAYPYPDKSLPGLNRDLRLAVKDWKGIRRQDLLAMSDAELDELAEGDVTPKNEPVGAHDG